MEQFKIRASALGQIMTNGRGKDTMGATAQSYCEMWLKEQLYNRRKDFSNKYTQKGIIVEDNSLDLVADFLGLGMLIKNAESFSNDYMTGTPDIIKPFVLDVKSSWSWETFPLFDEQDNMGYWWQLQAYMILTNTTTSKLVYVLTDTPQHLIEREARYKVNDYGYDYDEILATLTATMTYADVDINKRVRVFDVDKEDGIEAKIFNRVNECRNYIDKLLKQL